MQRTWLIALPVAIGVVAAACGNGPPDAEVGAPGPAPTTARSGGLECGGGFVATEELLYPAELPDVDAPLATVAADAVERRLGLTGLADEIASRGAALVHAVDTGSVGDAGVLVDDPTGDVAATTTLTDARPDSPREAVLAVEQRSAVTAVLTFAEIHPDDWIQVSSRVCTDGGPA